MFKFLLATAIVLSLSGCAFAQTLSGQSSSSNFVLIGVLKHADMNSISDQTIAIHSPTVNYRVQAIFVANPSISLTTAIGGIYSGSGKTGVIILAANTGYTPLTTNAPNTAGNVAAETLAVSNVAFNQTSLFLSLTTPQGAAATADFYVYGVPLP